MSKQFPPRVYKHEIPESPLGFLETYFSDTSLKDSTDAVVTTYLSMEECESLRLETDASVTAIWSDRVEALRKEHTAALEELRRERDELRALLARIFQGEHRQDYISDLEKALAPGKDSNEQ